MSIETKQRVAGIVSLVCAVVMVVCISRMIPYALSDETAKLKLWFGLMMLAFIVSLPAGVCYYYFRSKMHSNNSLDRLHVEVNTLSKLTEQDKQSKNSSK